MIVCPFTNNKYSLNSDIGRLLLREYISTFLNGGSKDLTMEDFYKSIGDAYELTKKLDIKRLPSPPLRSPTPTSWRSRLQVPKYIDDLPPPPPSPVSEKAKPVSEKAKPVPIPMAEPVKVVREDAASIPVAASAPSWLEMSNDDEIGELEYPKEDIMYDKDILLSLIESGLLYDIIVTLLQLNNESKIVLKKKNTHKMLKSRFPMEPLTISTFSNLVNLKKTSNQIVDNATIYLREILRNTLRGTYEKEKFIITYFIYTYLKHQLKSYDENHPMNINTYVENIYETFKSDIHTNLRNIVMLVIDRKDRSKYRNDIMVDKILSNLDTLHKLFVFLLKYIVINDFPYNDNTIIEIETSPKKYLYYDIKNNGYYTTLDDAKEKTNIEKLDIFSVINMILNDTKYSELYDKLDTMTTSIDKIDKTEKLDDVLRDMETRVRAVSPPPSLDESKPIVRPRPKRCSIM